MYKGNVGNVHIYKLNMHFFLCEQWEDRVKYEDEREEKCEDDEFCSSVMENRSFYNESKKDKCTHLKDNKKYGFETCKEI